MSSIQQIGDRIHIVLIGTTQPGNIGGAIRAMKNMGLSKLRLIEPSVFPSDRAIWRAAGAVDLLAGVEVFDNIDQALADCQLVIGTSARERRVSWPIAEPKSMARRVVDEAQNGHQIAIVFGREDSGLTNDELQRCHWHVHIPSNPEYSSLNLCAAVQVICYEIRQQALSAKGSDSEWDTALATNQELEYLYEHLEKVMIDVKFHDTDNPKQTITRMRRLFQRIRPDINEVQILRGLLTAIDRQIIR